MFQYPAKSYSLRYPPVVGGCNPPTVGIGCGYPQYPDKSHGWNAYTEGYTDNGDHYSHGCIPAAALKADRDMVCFWTEEGGYGDLYAMRMNGCEPLTDAVHVNAGVLYWSQDSHSASQAVYMGQNNRVAYISNPNLNLLQIVIIDGTSLEKLYGPKNVDASTGYCYYMVAHGKTNFFTVWWTRKLGAGNNDGYSKVFNDSGNQIGSVDPWYITVNNSNAKYLKSSQRPGETDNYVCLMFLNDTNDNDTTEIIIACTTALGQVVDYGIGGGTAPVSRTQTEIGSEPKPLAMCTYKNNDGHILIYKEGTDVLMKTTTFLGGMSSFQEPVTLMTGNTRYSDFAWDAIETCDGNYLIVAAESGDYYNSAYWVINDDLEILQDEVDLFYHSGYWLRWITLHSNVEDGETGDGTYFMYFKDHSRYTGANRHPRMVELEHTAL